MDSAGNVYVALPAISAIRKVAPDGAISTVVSGTAEGAAQPIRPTALTVDGAGNLYFVDGGSLAIRKATSAGKIESFAGNGTAGSGVIVSGWAPCITGIRARRSISKRHCRWN